MSGVGTAVFVGALIALVVVPRQARRAARELMPSPEERRDTAALLHQIAEADARARTAETALAEARGAAARLARQAAMRDTLAPALRARRDSLAAARASLQRLIERAEDAPLPASYRALGEAPELHGLPRVAALLDTLAEIEQSRAEFGAAGGVDPIFVALTARAAQIGRELQRIAEAREAALAREMERLSPPVPTVVVPDTIPLLHARDSAVAAGNAARRNLAEARAVNRALDLRAARARAAASLGASVPAMLAAALVIGLAAGFGVALTFELRRPRVADSAEAEAIAGARVLVTIGRPARPPVRRRSADRELAPLIEPTSDTYRLLYTQLANSRFDLPLVTVIGDAPLVTATVAANLAATAARQARTTLLVDTDVAAHPVADVVRTRPTPGMVDVLARDIDWPEAITSVVVGRDRTMDVLPSGVLERGAPGAATGDALARTLAHFTRRYECVVVSAPAPRSGDAQLVVSAPDAGAVIVCVCTARTRVAAFRTLLDSLRAREAPLRGIVVWDRNDPIPHTPAPTRDPA